MPARASEQPQDSSEKKSGNVIKSPLVGTFYASPAEDADPFVQVGEQVQKGKILAIVEAMKLMNEIESEFDGTIEEILVEKQENEKEEKRLKERIEQLAAGEVLVKNARAGFFTGISGGKSGSRYCAE